jgi:hypothetical protein
MFSIVGFALFGIYVLSWDDLVSHLSIGIAIGIFVSTAVLHPELYKARPRTRMGAQGSAFKTVAFWVLLLAAVYLIYRLFHGPAH